jgi:hypothetical protein
LSTRLGYVFTTPGLSSDITLGCSLKMKDFAINYAYIYDLSSSIDNHWISADLYFWPVTTEELALEKKKRMEKIKADRQKKIMEEQLTGEEAGAEKTAVGQEMPSYITDSGTSTKKVNLDIELLQTQIELKELKIYTIKLQEELKRMKLEIEKLQGDQTK